MLNSAAVVPEEQRFILSNLPPSPAQVRLALAVVVSIFIIFALISAGPLKGVHLARVDAFVPAYVTAMFVCDSITAILLYTHFSIVRSRSTLVIASGYVFTALILIPFVLVFPNIFVSGNLIGGLQSTSWLWFCQHAGFPVFVICYALSKEVDLSQRAWRGTVRAAIGLSATLTATIVGILAFACIAGDHLLPRVASDHLHFSSLWPYFIGAPIVLLSTSSLIVLWIRRRTVLDLWLMVVMWLYFLEVFLSYYPNPERFSLGWYTVRVIGILSSSLVLMVLLHEITTLYARLLGAVLGQRREREARLMTGDAVAASIAHEFRQPLTAMVTSADAGYRFLDRRPPNVDRAKDVFKRIAADGHRAAAVVDSIRSNFKNDDKSKTWIDVNELITEALTLENGSLQTHDINVQAEPSESLPQVQGNRVQLQQVLVNLITNAIDAMTSRDGPRMLLVKSQPNEGIGVMVSVADTGVGINEQDLDRIFNPLFTTKSDGMGMGLSICKAIIEAHNGRLWTTANSPRGSIFQFTLPAGKSMAVEA